MLVTWKVVIRLEDNLKLPCHTAGVIDIEPIIARYKYMRPYQTK
jgi:hypothetical protein